MPRAGIALGSNLGDRMANLSEAIRLLSEIAENNAIFLKARTYRTKPLDCPPGSPDFFNTVVEFSFAGSASELFLNTRSIETSMGRQSNPQRNAPRIIDLDILYLGNLQTDSKDLILPHPRMHERSFVLQPLADICPNLVLPGHSKCVSRLLEELTANEPALIAID
jgi:2-amino-4-hydroxy-6-hydroxymethyldihydropteridine diphosphokinase